MRNINGWVGRNFCKARACRIEITAELFSPVFASVVFDEFAREGLCIILIAPAARRRR